MRKAISLLLILTLCLSLASCGKSEAVKNAEDLIEAIGEVTADSADAISRAEEAYAALTEEEKAQVSNASLISHARISFVEATFAALGEITVDSEPAILEAEAAYESLTNDEKTAVTNYDILTAAKEALERAYFEQYRLSLVDEWVDIDRGFLIKLDADGHASLQEPDGKKLIFDWKLSDDMQCIEFTGHVSFELNVNHIFEYTALVNPLTYNLNLGTLVRKSEETALIDQYFTLVELTAENMCEYIGESVLLGKVMNEWGEETDESVYYFKSKAYENGLVHVYASDDYRAEGDGFALDNPFAPFRFASRYLGSDELPAIERIKGTMYFLSSEYVTDAKLLPEFNARVITLTNGSVIVTKTYCNANGFPVDDIRF